MSSGVVPDATSVVTAPASRRIARLVSDAALVVGALTIALLAFQVHTQPPCKPGYVRFIDLSWYALLFPVVFSLPALAVRLVARRPGRHIIGAAIALVMLGLLLWLAVLTVMVIQNAWGSQYDPTCWTF